MNFWQRSIQWQLIISMGAAILVSVLVVIGIYSRVANQQAEQYLLGQALPARVEAVRNDLERVLTEPLTAAAALASNSLLVDWLAGGEEPAEQANFVRYLAAVQAQNQALTSFVVALDTGNYLTAKGLDRTLTRGADSAWFYNFIDSGESRSLSIDIDKSTGVPTLFINQRIQSAGKTLGVGGIGLGVSAMSDLIRNTHFGKAGVVYLVSGDGQVKIHPQAQLSNNSDLTQLVGRDAAQQLLSNDGQVQHFERQGEAYLAMAMPLKTLGWQLVAEVPEAEIYAEARAALFTTALISLAVALCCLGLVVVLARGLVRPLRRVTAALVEIGSGGGDLTRRLDESRADELGDLARGFNRFLESLRGMIGGVLNTSEQLRGSASQVAQLVENTAGRAGQQQEMTDMVATAVHEMGLTVQEIARNANDAAGASQRALDEAQQARMVVSQSIDTVDRMSGDIGHAAGAVTELAEQVASIDQVLAVIRGISEQTNLLALNAAIEAARAGELGRGFAVVADEVRTLASRTQSSTGEIQQMILRLKQGAGTAVTSMQASQSATSAGVESSQRTGSSLGAITDQVERISDMNHQIATATEEQSSVTEEINRNVQGIADLAHATADEVHRGRQDCQTLRQLAEDLARQMGSFRL
ncbi:MAG: methyl-accepting chemotaxis protein [Pseudomonadaceae bacterium]|jgi:methyl-accepting chemotaxis protein|nr:methyl-accepting chemotaxis protein [Pseudomonadaceae bacterium]